MPSQQQRTAFALLAGSPLDSFNSANAVLCCWDGIYLRFMGALEVLERLLLLLAIRRVAPDQYFKVHAVGVELRSIHAGEFTFAVYQHAAAAAHPSAVNHRSEERR